MCSYIYSHFIQTICKNIRSTLKACVQRGFEFTKKNVIYNEKFTCNEKSGNVTKVKLVTKIKKHKQLYFRTLVLAS